MDRAEVAVIGGSGFYAFLEHARALDDRTPYGAASAPVSVGQVAGRSVAFLPRHGPGHALPPHRINYRANLWLLRSLGVRQVLAPCAVGSLVAELGPGDLVVPDQLIDRTSGRDRTFVEAGAVHPPFADPYCPRLRSTLSAVDGVTADGTMVVIDGPRFSTRAESRAYAAQGGSLINMTGQPEASLARELGMCYAAIALVTDRDAGVEEGHGVDQESVFALFEQNLDRVRALLVDVIGDLPTPQGCTCSSWRDGLALSYAIPGDDPESR